MPPAIFGTAVRVNKVCLSYIRVHPPFMSNATPTDYLSVTVSVTVSSVRYTKQCVDGQPSEHYFVEDTRGVLFSWSTVATMPQPKMTRAIVNDFGQYSVPYAAWYYCVSGCTVNLTCISDN